LKIFAESGPKNPGGRVIACFNGHDHTDEVTQIEGIWFIQVNSMSYDWLGEQWAHLSYPDSIHAQYPAMKFTAPYRDPLWALVTLTSDGKILIKGRKTGWVGPSPADLKVPVKAGGLAHTTLIRDTVLYFNQPVKK
jgi:hypothetical protein